MVMGFDRVQMEILGESFSVRGDPASGDIQKVEAFLKGELDSLLERYPNLSEKRLAVLAAFDLADELLRVRTDYQQLISIIDKH